MSIFFLTFVSVKNNKTLRLWIIEELMKILEKV